MVYKGGLFNLVGRRTVGKVELLLGFLFRKAEVGQFALRTNLAVATDLSGYKGKVVFDFGEMCPYLQSDIVSRRYRLFEFDIQVGRHARGLQFSGHEPAGNLVDE